MVALRYAPALLAREARNAALSPRGLSGFTAALGRTLGGAAVLAAGEKGVLTHVEAFAGIDPVSLAAYRTRFQGASPWRGWTVKARRGEVAGGREVNPLDEAAYERTEFYQGFLRPNDLHHGAGARVECSKGGIYTDLAILRPRAAGPVSPAELGVVAGALPELRRALAARRLLLAATASAARIDSPSVGVLLADGSGKLIFADERGTDFLSDGDAIGARARVLCCRSPAAEARLHLLMARASGGLGGGDMLIPRGGAPLRVTVVPVPAGSDAFGERAAACMLLLEARVK